MIGLSIAAVTLGSTRTASAYHEGDQRIIDETAHTLRPRELRIGLWDIDFGPTSFITVGTDTAPWALSFLVHSVVSNGHAKVRLLHTKPLTLSVGAAAYYTDLSSAGSVVTGSGSLLLLPISAYASSDISKRVSLHLGVVYSHMEVDGDVGLDLGAAPARATIAATAVQIHAMTEYRLSRVVAFTLQFHGQPYASAPAVRLTTTDSAGNKVNFTGTVTPTDRTAVAAVASVVFSGKNFNVRVGGGYGATFLPSMGVMIPIAMPLPELDAYVRF